MDHPKIQTLPDGTLLLNFGSYGQEVEVAAISGDGQRVLTVRDVGVAEIWDARSGDKVGELRPDSPLEGTTGTAPTSAAFQVFIESAALDRDGSIALLGLNDGTAGTFRVSDGTRLATLHPPDQPPAADWCVIRAVAYSPDGTFALVGFANRAVGVFSASGGRLVAFLAPASGDRLVGEPGVRSTLASSVAMSADQRHVFAGNVDLTATIWDIASQKVVLEATEHAEKILALFDNAHGVGWATTGGNVWCARDGGAPGKVIVSGAHWDEARFAGGQLLARSVDNAIHHWRWTLAGQHEVLHEPGAASREGWAVGAETLGFAGDALLHACGGRRVKVRRGGHEVDIARDAKLVTACFSPRGDLVATTGWKDTVELWSAHDGALLRELPSPGGVGDFTFSADGTLLAVGEIGHGGGAYPRHVYLYETATGRELARHAEHAWQVSHVQLSPDVSQIASLGDDIIVWNIALRSVVARIAVDRVIARFQFLSDGRLLVVDEGRAAVYRTGQLLVEMAVPMGYRTRWCVSEDERTLDIAVTQGVARFDLETGASRGVVAAAIPRPSWVWGAAIWRTAFGVFIHQSDGPRGWVEPAHLSADGLVVVRTRNGIEVIDTRSETTAPVATFPFEGRLRASRIVDRTVLLVDHRGQLVRHALPSLDRGDRESVIPP